MDDLNAPSASISNEEIPAKPGANGWYNINAVKHHLFKLVVFLLLGAIINIAVACGCALAKDRHWDMTPWFMSKDLTLRQVQWWVVHAPDDFPLRSEAK